MARMAPASATCGRRSWSHVGRTVWRIRNANEKREDIMRASLAALSGALVLSAFSVAPPPARAQGVTFLSTQMRPLEEAQRTHANSQWRAGQNNLCAGRTAAAAYPSAGGRAGIAHDQLGRCAARRVGAAG
jgi:hypothetical protein